jgi:hypothetical protein
MGVGAKTKRKSTASPLIRRKSPQNTPNYGDASEKRMAARRQYAVSDDIIVAKLVDMEIVYDDAKKEWRTRALSTVAKKTKI